MGDPAGIGPEVAIKALADPTMRSIAQWVVVGEAWVVERVGRQVGYQLSRTTTDFVSDDGLDDRPEAPEPVVLDLQQVGPADVRMGQLAATCGRAAVAYVRRAVELCQSGQADAVVTGPLNKEAVVLSGLPFVGHTEFLAELCGVDESRMLLINDQLAVVHVSTHCSLSEATRLSPARIRRTIELGSDALTALRGRPVRVAVCGLNPHAGENGLFGTEEQLAIIPAIAAAREAGIPCEGPFPADTLFVQAARGKYDLVVAMYHDQGCIPMKLLDFEHTVNVTLGLPLVRTSVDHGTAFDIAGKNLADPEDMKAAMRMAVAMVARRADHVLRGPHAPRVAVEPRLAVR